MKNDTKEIDNPTATAPLDYLTKPEYTLKQIILKVSDFAVVVGATSILLTVVQHPISTGMINLIEEKRFLSGPWGYAAFKALYKGVFPSAISGAGRQSYIGATKQLPAQHESRSSEKEVDALEKRRAFAHKLSRVALIAAGDVIVTQIPETISKLAQRKISAEQYKWRTPSNLAALSKLGIFSRFSRSTINFTGLCLATNFYAKYIPGDNEVIKQTGGGMASGLSATLVSFPFGLYTDYLVTKVTATEGTLITPKTSWIIRDAIQQARAMNSQEMLKFARSVATQGGLRALRNGVGFAVIAGVSAALGPEPLSNIVNQQNTPNENPTQKFKQEPETISPSKPQEAHTKTPNP